MQPRYSLTHITLYFLKLGTWGFGGPVALVNYMHRDLVENKAWITDEEYKEGLALAQLAPGPLAAQLGIYIGYIHYGLIGATLTGLAFILPSFVMVILLGMAYQQYGGLPWMQAIFYGVGASVVGIITISAYKLTIKSISKFEFPAMRSKWLLWTFYILSIVVTVVTQREEIWLFISCGVIYMLLKAPPAWLKKPASAPVVLLISTGFWKYDTNVLPKIAVFFAKAGAFVFGSGLAIVPFLHSGVVKEYGWLTENQFIDAVAVAMITPGPVVITVAFIGYLIAGFPGACVAALATFLPCYIFTVALAPSFKKIAKNNTVKAFVEGITASVIGALVGAVIVIGVNSIKDIPAALIAIATALILIYSKKVQEPYLIGFAALIGLIIKFI
ncbi:chromate transporter [Mucilaginibacter limnophilus]|uniref:Chromate transporter n=1 Tax=Mucilaginibacter limnophilus TaxID=1932778 RepID=A0A437MTE6_9SPHI|nr:chromate transporter [Mucilaginibacter limnophilus]RVU00912.1 chromate transporter [Mucilaginibacter limnophilus]